MVSDSLIAFITVGALVLAVPAADAVAYLTHRLMKRRKR